MGAFTCGLFFLRFWRKARDRLFLMFSFTFFLLGIERVISASIADISDENRVAIYLIRLAAFLLILFGIWDKNRTSEKSPA